MADSGQVITNYGSVGPGSDLPPEILRTSQSPGGTQSPENQPPDNQNNQNAVVRVSRPAPRVAAIGAILFGIFFAFAVRSVRPGQEAWKQVTGQNNAPGRSGHNSSRDPRRVDGMQPQRQAEVLLEQAVGHSDGAVQQISLHVDRWRGHLQWTPEMANLFTAALNSDDMQVRASAIDVELATYGLAKNETSLNSVLQSAESSDPAQRAWAVWALGLLGNRRVGTDQVVQVLTAHVQDKSEDDNSRHWAVEALAIVGTTETIPVLLDAMHNDPSPQIRERAACGLAESGMFTHEQRMTAVPQLINYTEDPALDDQTHRWAFQALSDITHQHFSDAAAWRSWYESARPE